MRIPSSRPPSHSADQSTSQGGANEGLARSLLTGLTLAAVTIPQQMATAKLGGFELQIGFYAFIAATIGFAIAGASRVLTAGIDSTTMPIFAGTLAALAVPGGPSLVSTAVTLALLVGIFLVTGGLLRLGWVADLLSIPVVTGFLAGIAVHIAVSQLPSLFGFSLPATDMFGRIAGVAARLSEINPYSTAIGLAVFLITVVSAQISGRIPGTLIALVLATASVMVFDLQRRGVAVIGPLPGGLPRLVMPDLRIDDLRQLLPLALLISLIVMMQTAVVSQSFPDPGGKPINLNRDFFGIGIANLVSGLAGATPVNASPPLTSVVRDSGGVSQAGPLTAAAIVLAFVLFGGGLLAHVPEAALAGVLFSVALHLVRFGVIRAVARQAPTEFALICITTAAIVILPIQAGVAIGVGLSLLHGVWMTIQTRPIEFQRIPGTTVWWPPEPGKPGEFHPDTLVIGFQAPLLFTNADIFQQGVRRLVARETRPVSLVVLEAGGIANVDYTAAEALRAVIDGCKAAGKQFAIARLESVRAREALERFGILAQLGPDRLFHSVDDAVRSLAAPDGAEMS
jgi:sulfate permease, SulP family